MNNYSMIYVTAVGAMLAVTTIVGDVHGQQVNVLYESDETYSTGGFLGERRLADALWFAKGMGTENDVRANGGVSQNDCVRADGSSAVLALRSPKVGIDETRGSSYGVCLRFSTSATSDRYGCFRIYDHKGHGVRLLSGAEVAQAYSIDTANPNVSYGSIHIAFWALRENTSRPFSSWSGSGTPPGTVVRRETVNWCISKPPAPPAQQLSTCDKFPSLCTVATFGLVAGIAAVVDSGARARVADCALSTVAAHVAGEAAEAALKDPVAQSIAASVLQQAFGGSISARTVARDVAIDSFKRQLRKTNPGFADAFAVGEFLHCAFR